VKKVLVDVSEARRIRKLLSTEVLKREQIVKRNRRHKQTDNRGWITLSLPTMNIWGKKGFHWGLLLKSLKIHPLLRNLHVTFNANLLNQFAADQANAAKVQFERIHNSGGRDVVQIQTQLKLSFLRQDWNSGKSPSFKAFTVELASFSYVHTLTFETPKY
jgi:hypothetical protein